MKKKVEKPKEEVVEEEEEVVEEEVASEEEEVVEEEEVASEEEVVEEEEVVVEDEVKVVQKEEKSSESVDVGFLIEFLDAYVERSGNTKDILKITVLQEHLDDFCKDNNHDTYSKADFKKFLSDKWGKAVNSAYKGYRIIEEEDDEDEV